MNTHELAQVVVAMLDDIPAWLVLAAEVEPLFGPMVNDPQFHAAIERSIGAGMAFCVREAHGPPGTPLLGGLLFSISHAPIYKINWLAVTARARRMQIGLRLVHHALALVVPPAEIEVITFVTGDPEGEPARQFYESLDFTPAEIVVFPPAIERQMFRRKIV